MILIMLACTNSEIKTVQVVVVVAVVMSMVVVGFTRGGAAGAPHQGP